MPKTIEQLTAEVDALETSIAQTQADMDAHLAKLEKMEAEWSSFSQQVRAELRRLGIHV